MDAKQMKRLRKGDRVVLFPGGKCEAGGTVAQRSRGDGDL